jgi:hypothetical protein
MNRILQLTISVAIVSVVAVATVAAQSARFGLGGGLTMPLSDYNTLDNAGWHALGKVEIGIPMTPVSLRVDGMYAQTSRRAPATGSTKLAGGTADLVLRIPIALPGVKPYLVVGGGLFNYNPGSGSTTKFTWGGGFGTSVGVGPIHAFAEARYLNVQLTGAAVRFAPVTVGLSFGS